MTRSKAVSRAVKKVKRADFLFGLFALLLIFSSCNYEKTDMHPIVARDWRVQQQDTSIKDTNYLYLRPDNSFEQVSGPKRLKLEGNWNLNDSLLKLNFNALPDSLNYDVRVTQASATQLVLEKDGKKQVYRIVHKEQTFENQIADFGRGTLGILLILLTAFLLSTRRRSIDWRLVLVGLALQIIFAILVLKVDFVRDIFNAIARVFVELLNFTLEGSIFLFGDLVKDVDSFGFIFAFQVLPSILFFSALTSVLYYLGFLQKVVYGIAWLMNRTMRLSGAESLAAAGNIFLGQTESPLLIKPYIDKMTRSEILSLMTGGMATIAGGVLFAYIGFLGGTDPAEKQLFATHLLTASIMSAPAALLMAKMLMPETEKVDQKLLINKERVGKNVLDAIANGTSEGLRLAVNVGAMLLVFTALMAMFNYLFYEWIGSWTGLNDWIRTATSGRYDGFSIQFVLGHIFAPFAWIMGVNSADLTTIGLLLGEKTVLNEFIAYATMAELKESGALLDRKSIIIATYALCGFANFASIGIQIGGIGALAPNRRALLSELGIRALVGGTLACFLTACIAGMLA